MHLRFIPTHVGNSQQAADAQQTRAVHPHACGELQCHRVSGGPSVGSSPRMWGTPVSPCVRRSQRRFIPTHVGNSMLRPSLNSVNSVHPHACGELLTPTLEQASIAGSSPRMWGTHVGNISKDCSTRFIPTHVGNSPTQHLWERGKTVHPHACGELTGLPTVTLKTSGSSPRMWGTRIQKCTL